MFQRKEDGKKPQKYKSQRTNGFSSKFESAIYDMLLLRQKLGEIKNIRCQHPTHLTRAQIGLKVDFSYEDMNGKITFVEAKGFPTEGWKIKKKLWAYYGPGPLEIWQGDYRRPKLSETLIPKGAND